MTDEKDEAAILLEQAMTTGNVELPRRGAPQPKVEVMGVEDFLGKLRQAHREQVEADRKSAVLRTWKVDGPGLENYEVQAHTMLFAEEGRVVFMLADEHGEDFIAHIVAMAQFTVTLVEKAE